MHEVGVWNSDPARSESVGEGGYEVVVQRSSSASLRKGARKYGQVMGGCTGAWTTVYFSKKQTRQQGGELVMTKNNNP